jgi:hypothetical protein
MFLTTCSVGEQNPPSWTVSAFFAWAEKQPDRYELVDGFPLKMMAGAKNVHDDIVVNLIAELRARLRGGGCRPFTGDGSVQTRPGQIRRPDVGVDCGARDFDSFRKVEDYKDVSSVDYIALIEPNEALALVWSKDGQVVWREDAIRGLDHGIEMPTIGVKLERFPINWKYRPRERSVAIPRGAWSRSRRIATLRSRGRRWGSSGSEPALAMSFVHEGIEFPVGPRLVQIEEEEGGAKP